jgi:hypothetical protein
MGQRTAEAPAPRETRAALACRLRHRAGRRGPSPAAGEVELENVSGEPVEIEVTMHPLQHLDLVVRDASGVAVPAAPYGHLFSPREVPYTLRLAPGEKYVHNVSLLGTLPEGEPPPGRYQVHAVYEYRGLRAVSEPLWVELPARGANDGS